MATEEFRQVNPVLSESPRIWVFSAGQFAVLAGTSLGIFVLLSMTPWFSILWELAFSLSGGLSGVAIVGDKWWQTLGPFWPPTPLWIVGSARHSNPTQKQRVGNRPVSARPDAKPKRTKPFEDDLRVLTYVRVAEGDRRLEATVHRSEDGAVLTFEMGFAFQPIPTTIPSDRVEATYNPIENAQKELPEGERLTVYFGSWRDDSERQAELESTMQLLCQQGRTNEALLVASERGKVQKLTSTGARLKHEHICYLTYTCRVSGEVPQGPFAKLTGKLGELWQTKIAEQGDLLTAQRYCKALRQAAEACRRYQQLLSKMGLKPQLQPIEQLWRDSTRRLGNANSGPLPHYLLLDREGLREVHYREQLAEGLERPVAIHADELHLSSLAIAHGVPFADAQWVYVRQPNGRGQYCGVLILTERPGGWSDKLAQLNYLHEQLARKPQAYDIEIVSELTPADRRLTRERLQSVTKRSYNKDLDVQQRSRTVDVTAQETAKRSVSAEREIYQGNRPVHLALVVLVYRSTLEELESACQTIAGELDAPAKLERETNYAWQVWLQTQRLRSEALLLNPYNRRLTFFTSEAPGLLKLTGTRPTRCKGLELIAIDTRVPVHVDIHPQQPEHSFLSGSTGSGKSLVEGGMIEDAITRGLAVSVVDSPNEDGFGSYTHFFDYYGGDYYNIRSESLNALEVPDLRRFDAAEREERYEDNKHSIKLFLKALILGQKPPSGLLSMTINSVVSVLVEQFFKTEPILRRYEAAIAAGQGTQVWQDTPTLHDLLPLCNPECLTLEGSSGDQVDQAIRYIQLRLRYWIDNRIGKAIARPSTIRSDSKLLCVALTGISDDEEAAVLALMAYAAATRQSLQFKRSLTVIDELSVLSKYDAIAEFVGESCAKGRKAERTMVLAAQEPNSVLKCVAADQIFKNLTRRLTGYLTTDAVSTFEEVFKYPPEIIRQNAGESFNECKQRGATRWLVEQSGKFTPCEYYPSPALLALMANNRAEVEARNRYFERYPDKVQALAEFSKHYMACLKEGKPL